MFKGDPDATTKAKAIANMLSDHNLMLNHGRLISYRMASEMGLKVDLLENDQKRQDAVLSSYHATINTFNLTSSAKIIENNLGKAFIKAANVDHNVVLQQPTRNLEPVQPQ